VAKPEVSIQAARTLVSGTRCAIDIDVAFARETKVDFIRARLIGDQGWRIGSGKSQVSMRRRYPELEADLMGEALFPAGTVRRFSTAFELPADVPPTHAIEPAWARMRLRIHISIPWRIDGRYHYDFAVRLPAPAEVVRSPLVMRSTLATAAHDKPRIELGLASTRLIAGETLVGTCALFHLDDDEPRDVNLSLVPMFDLFGRGRLRERRGSAIKGRMVMPPGSAGTGVAFRLELPRTMTPSFTSETHRLAWWLVASTGSFLGPKVDVAVPLEVVDATAAAHTSKLTTAPRLGDERIATTFAQVASHRGWRGSDPDRDELAADGQFAIEHELGGCRLQIAYSYRDQDGTFVVSRLEHPSLGLGLSVTPSSTLRHVFFRDIEIDIGTWDRANLVQARYAEQTVPVLRAIVPALQRHEQLGTLLQWTDDALVFELPASSVDGELVDVLASALEQLAPVVATAQRDVTPPPGIPVDAAAWQALARELDGTLSLGDLSIRGTFEGAPAELAVWWDLEQQPQALRAAVGDPEAASAELRAIDLSLPRPTLDVFGAPSANQLVELVAQWPEDIVELRVADGIASAHLQLPAAADAARVRKLVAGLRAVLVALDPGRGPYR
jgi:hypothetical protein